MSLGKLPDFVSDFVAKILSMEGEFVLKTFFVTADDMSARGENPPHAYQVRIIRVDPRPKTSEDLPGKSVEIMAGVKAYSE